MSMNTYDSYKALETAKEALINKIKATMLPGAEAMRDSRIPTDDTIIQVEDEIHGVRLWWYTAQHPGTWKENGPSSANVSTWLDGYKDKTPEVLHEVLAFATRRTSEIVRECATRLEVYRVTCDALIAAYNGE